MLRIPHCLDNRLTDVVEVAALRTGRSLLPIHFFFFYVSGTRLLCGEEPIFKKLVVT
jgi:hypothetical protein